MIVSDQLIDITLANVKWQKEYKKNSTVIRAHIHMDARSYGT